MAIVRYEVQQRRTVVDGSAFGWDWTEDLRSLKAAKELVASRQKQDKEWGLRIKYRIVRFVGEVVE